MDPIDMGGAVRPLTRLCCAGLLMGAIALVVACGDSTPAQGHPAAAPSAVDASSTPLPSPPTPPPGAVPSPGSTDSQKAFMECMKAHGAPVPGPGSGTIVNGPGAPDQSAMQKALAACQPLLNGGASGSGPGSGGN